MEPKMTECNDCGEMLDSQCAKLKAALSEGDWCPICDEEVDMYREDGPEDWPEDDDW